MDDAKTLWQWWQSLLLGYGTAFTRPGWVRFVQWLTGMVLCPEKHTITQILISLGMASRWRVLESFAEYGAWRRDEVERQTIRLVEQEQPARCGGFHPVALDDTKELRGSPDVWGTCTFFEPSARSPNRAQTVRAHNWVVAGDLVPGDPWTYLPHSSRLYFRRNQVPKGESFRTKNELAVEMLRQVDEVSTAPVLGVFDGAYAKKTVVRRCLKPAEGQRRIEILTRLRVDSRLYAPLEHEGKRRGPKRKWGKRLPAPQKHDQWTVAWKRGKAHIYGKMRKFRYKRVECRWSVAGPDEPVHAYVFAVTGFKEPWFMATTALTLTPEEVVALFSARFRQENGFREHKQLMGMQECKAWTKEPVLRTFQVQMVAITVLRLLQFRLERQVGEDWWDKPEWNQRKQHASLLDLRRLLWSHRAELAKVLLDLEDLEKFAPDLQPRRKLGAKAA